MDGETDGMSVRSHVAGFGEQQRHLECSLPGGHEERDRLIQDRGEELGQPGERQ